MCTSILIVAVRRGLQRDGRFDDCEAAHCHQSYWHTVEYDPEEGEVIVRIK
mgnify:CR=1 FL=1